MPHGGSAPFLSRARISSRPHGVLIHRSGPKTAIRRARKQPLKSFTNFDGLALESADSFPIHPAATRDYVDMHRWLEGSAGKIGVGLVIFVAGPH